MKERLLKKKEIAERMGTSPKHARELLFSHGVLPIDYGRGGGRGLRWLESAVDAVILAMHKKAQPQALPVKKSQSQKTGLSMPLTQMSANNLYAYLESQTSLQ